MIRWWWRYSTWPDRIVGTVFVGLTLPAFVWSTVTGQSGRAGWGVGVAFGIMLLWSWLTLRQVRREQQRLDAFDRWLRGVLREQGIELPPRDGDQ